jgi:hypothetical protein
MLEYRYIDEVKRSDITDPEENLYDQIIGYYNKLSEIIKKTTDAKNLAYLTKVQKAVAKFMSLFKTSIVYLISIDPKKVERLQKMDKDIFPIISSDSADKNQTELLKLIEETTLDDFMSVTKLLEFINKLNEINKFGTGLLDERAVCGDIGGKKVAGETCINIITQCLKGELSECLAEFSKLDLDKGIDLKTMDYGVALHLAKKIGFADKTVEEAITKIRNENTKFVITDKLVFLFNAIKARITDVTLTSYISKPNTLRIRAVPVRDVTDRAKIGLGQRGGGNNMDYYNNFIINVDALKSNLVMKGGSNSVVLKQNIHYLTTLLQNHKKQIDPNDLNKINRLIDSITKGEENLKQIKGVIDGLITAINIKKIDLTDFSGNPQLTYTMLEELNNKANDRQGKNLQKVSTCIGLFDHMIPTLNGFLLQR